MKKNSFITILIIVFLLSFACGPTPEEAAVYNSKIVELQNDVVVTINDLENAFKTYKPEEIKPALNNTKNVTEINLRTLKYKIRFLDNDSLLYIGAENYFNQIIIACDNEYSIMYKLYCLPDDEYDQILFSEQEDKKNIIIKTAFNNFVKVQELFADKYLIELNKIKK